jgi:hypothetical protein
VTPLSITLDAVAALAAVGVAVAFLVARGVRTLKRPGSGACACPSAKGCGSSGGPTADDLRRAAARGAQRAASEEPPGTPAR